MYQTSHHADLYGVEGDKRRLAWLACMSYELDPNTNTNWKKMKTTYLAMSTEECEGFLRDLQATTMLEESSKTKDSQEKAV